MSRREQGAALEAVAARHLLDRGLALIAQNVSYRIGEIDLVMREGDTTVFVEVRYRNDARFGGALASVDGRKQRRIIAAARAWLAQHPDAARRPCRFDVVGIAGGSPYAIEHLSNAFNAEE